MKIELTKEEIGIITDALLSEMNELSNYRYNKFINQEDLRNYITKIRNIFDFLIAKEYDELTNE